MGLERFEDALTELEALKVKGPCAWVMTSSGYMKYSAFPEVSMSRNSLGW